MTCNTQSARNKHRRETQPNERQRGTGRRGEVARRGANQHCSSARKCPGQQLAGVGGGSITLSKGCQSQLCLAPKLSPLSAGMCHSFDSLRRSQTPGRVPALAPLPCRVTDSCVPYMYFGLPQGAAKSSAAKRADRFL